MRFHLPHPRARTQSFPHPTPLAAASPESRCDGLYAFLCGPELILEGPGPSSSPLLPPMGDGARADLSPVPGRPGSSCSRGLSFSELWGHQLFPTTKRTALSSQV